MAWPTGWYEPRPGAFEGPAFDLPLSPLVLRRNLSLKAAASVAVPRPPPRQPVPPAVAQGRRPKAAAPAAGIPPSQGRRLGRQYPQPSLKAAVPRPPPRSPVSPAVAQGRRPKAAASVAGTPSRRSRPPSLPAVPAAAPAAGIPPSGPPVPPAVAQGRRASAGTKLPGRRCPDRGHETSGRRHSGRHETPGQKESGSAATLAQYRPECSTRARRQPAPEIAVDSVPSVAAGAANPCP
jgi:hypothetical protein